MLELILLRHAHAEDAAGGADIDRPLSAHGQAEAEAAGRWLDERIYEAMPGTLVSVAEQHDEVERLMLVGHNPGLEKLVALLHSGRTGEYRGMPPAGVAVLSLSAGSQLEPGTAALTQFWWP